MRAVLQRVSSARVVVAGSEAGEIGTGLLILLGVAGGDTAADGEWLVQKIAALRIFPDDAGRMNRAVGEVGGGVLVVSQFTLLASTAKGTRPSFNGAARPELAIPLYDEFRARLAAVLARPVAAGVFAAEMQVTLVNEGPVTILLDSKVRE